MGATLTAVRVTGVTFFALSMFGTAKIVGSRKKLDIRDAVDLILLLSGLLILSYYLYRSIGDLIAFIPIQKAW